MRRMTQWMANALGGIKRGWPEIREIYRRIFTGPAKVRVEFHDYALTVAADVFWAIGRERGVSETESRTFELAIRTTRVFRRVNGRWRQIHHHGSIEQPELLDAYQRSVR